MWTVGIIGSFVFENEEASTVTVSVNHYGTLLRYHLFPNIEENVLNKMWFEQDYVSTTNVTREFLCNIFENRLIRRNVEVH